MKKMLYALMILFLFQLTGCSNILYTSSNTLSSEGSIPTKYLKIINQYVVIHADVEVAEKVRTDGFFYANAEKILFDVDTAKSLLWDDNNTKSHTTPDYGGAYFYGKDGDVLGIGSDNINFYSTWSTYVISAYKWDIRMPDYNRNLFSTTTEFENLSKKDAYRAIDKILYSFQPEVDFSYDYYAMDFKTVSDESTGIEANKYNWSSRDNSYYILIRQTCNETPILPIGTINYINFDSFYDAKALYGINGIESFYLNTLYKIKYEDKKVPLLSLDSIVNIFADKIDLTIVNSPIDITSLRLYSYPVNIGSNEYSMHPIWIFSGTISSDASSETKNPYNKAIDGITGEEIIL